MKTIIIVLFFILFSQSVLAVKSTYQGDTIWYKFDKALIELSSTNVVQSGVNKELLHTQMEQIKKVLGKLTIAEPSENERIDILFKDLDENSWNSHFKEIELIQSVQNSKRLVVFEDGTTFEKELGRYCMLFSSRNMQMKIFVSDLNDLEYFSTDEFDEKAKMASDYLEKEYEEKERKRIVGWLDLREDEVKSYFSKINNQNFDMLILSAGIGSGWVKNTFISDVSFRVGLSLGKKGMFKNAYFIDWNMMYDFSESRESKFFELNHFVSLGWDHNFSNTPEEDKWYGFSVGYLVKRNNDFFKDNTFRVSVNKKINDTFTIRPELYFNDFIKNVHPGIRVSVAF